MDSMDSMAEFTSSACYVSKSWTLTWLEVWWEALPGFFQQLPSGGRINTFQPHFEDLTEALSCIMRMLGENAVKTVIFQTKF